MVFAKKLETSSFFFFSAIGWKKVSSDLVDRKLVILYYKNIVLKKSKILHFFKMVRPWFLVKNWKFCPLFYFSKTGHNNVFCDLLDRKLAILDYKNMDLKKSEFFFLLKGVVHWFWSKIGNLLFFVLKQNRPRQSSLSRSRRKVTFFDYINVNLKSRNICFLYTWRNKNSIHIGDIGALSLTTFLFIKAWFIYC